MADIVSIIIPLHNSEKHISATIDSVLNQTYPHFELIIVDDRSTDNGLAIVREYAEKDGRIRIIEQERNTGAAMTRNVGIRAATGRYLTFLDSDDIWFPHMIETSINNIKEHDCGFVFASYKMLDEELQPLFPDFIVPDKVDYHNILKQNCVSCLTAFLDIERLGKKEMPLIRKRHDLGLWVQYLKEIDHAVGIKEPLAIYRIRKRSLSRNKLSAMAYNWEFYTKYEQLGYIKSTYYLVHWMIRGVVKYRRTKSLLHKPKRLVN